MRVLVIGNEKSKEELLGNTTDAAAIQWIKDPGDLPDITGHDACIDLGFDNTTTRTGWLKRLDAPLIIVNAVNTTLARLPNSFVRINGWNTFLQRNIIEAATANEENKVLAEKVFLYFNKKIQWVPDMMGFITPRVISSIINEAYFALQEKVSTPTEIDIAMKLGTNYPFGPFEWSEKIGLVNVHSLLVALSAQHDRYRPADLLIQTALN